MAWNTFYEVRSRAMNEYIAFDSHKHYTLMEREAVTSGRVVQRRIEHCPGAIRKALSGCQPGTTVAVEAMGSWYWIVQEIEQAGLVPALFSPFSPFGKQNGDNRPVCQLSP
jgi:hypothetical protein